ncbi:sulfatase-like hydrolase/transferase [Pontibacter cellulosilyticus]|uniref:Sulfatase-like hydrolase/transferase n=1 Tax=Pontibacter cellulosilyticus TaxID=1720253 RepID=A0A923N731_9BACT|nr:sulfatase-like hydrolase/transferase [Pontibacter cellulosilyticus]MBC5992626.1 sulfatase-like hydrolase/transferase [Pontibacter cellulosilyticus]
MAEVVSSGGVRKGIALKRVLYVLLLILALLLFWSCAGTSTSVTKSAKPFKTQNVIVVVIDGPRHSENWGNTPGLIPFMSGSLKSRGTFFEDFQNEGYTYTNSGHVAITTGVNQEIDNYGDELPANPSYFQYWLKATGKPATAAWLVMSKDKLHILANTKDSVWQGRYMPSVNAGKNGPGTGYRMDSLTIVEAKRILSQHKPNLMLINLMEPDGYAHAGNSAFYLRGIARSDRYVKQLWDYLRKDRNYKKNTALIITNDHGRHLDGIDGGWMEHGDNCAGCQRISLLAVGPDFKKGYTISEKYTLEDIPATIAPLIGVKMVKAEGEVIRDMFTRKAQKRLNAAVPVVQ